MVARKTAPESAATASGPPRPSAIPSPNYRNAARVRKALYSGRKSEKSKEENVDENDDVEEASESDHSTHENETTERGATTDAHLAAKEHEPQQQRQHRTHPTARSGSRHIGSSSSSTCPGAPLSSTSLSSFNTELANSGLVYFSRLPPHFKPQKLRQLLSSYGSIGRIYCTPEHAHVTRSREALSSSSSSSSARRRYTDGWVEFMDKRVAKAVALTLNGSTVGGRKRSFHYDDVWSCRYLKGFKWTHLTERTAYESKVREARRRDDVSRARREGEHYMQQVDKSRTMQQRKRKQHPDDHDTLNPRSTFHQRRALQVKARDEH